MVLIHDLSGKLVALLEQDLNKYKQETERITLETGRQLPRTRFGWLLSHYNFVASRRNNAIGRAIEEFNRQRGLPTGHVVFKNARSYARCMSPIEVDVDGHVVYRSANDPIWGNMLDRYLIFVLAHAFDTMHMHSHVV